MAVADCSNEKNPEQAKRRRTIAGFLVARIQVELGRAAASGQKVELAADAHVGRGAIALFWTLNPDYFEGVSLTALANRLGLHKAILSAEAAEARRKFGIKNRGQAHGWNFGKEVNGAPKKHTAGPLAEAALSQLKARLFRSKQ